MPKLRIGPPPEPPAKPSRFKSPKPPPALFEQLFPCSWRGIVVPISSMQVVVSQDLVQHKYWGVDSASVEATGRAPMQIEATIPFVNGIVPGKGETFGVLYPTVFREFLKAFTDRTSGILNHPELGGILCKPQNITFSHDAQRRDGVVATAHWVETTDSDDLDVKDPFENTSPIQAAQLAALSLDAAEIDCLALVPEAAFPEETFESFMGKVTGFVDSVTNTASLIANKPAQLMYRINRLQKSVERAGNVLVWPVVEKCELMKAAIHNMTTTTVEGTGPVSGSRRRAKFFTPALVAVSSLPGMAPFPNTMDDLLRLNPRLAATSAVRAGRAIYYYAS